MAASLFSGKQSFGDESAGKSQSLLGAVRTMEGDLEEARHGKPRARSSQAEQQEVRKTLPQGAVFQKMVNPFSEEGGKVLRAEVRTSGEPAGSPFGVMPRNKSTAVPNSFKQPSLKNGLSGIMPDGGSVLTNHSKKNHNILWASIVGVLSLAIIGGGVYYYFNQTSQIETATPLPVPDIPPAETTEPVVENIPQEPPYALDKPNYISFNTETVSSEDIKKTLSQAALRIEAASITQPVEFLVTDQNNNPLAFSRFAFLLKLDLDPEVLALVNETFSLYIYNDASHARLGLALTLKDAQAAALAIAKTETALPYALQTLILEPSVSVAKTSPFSSATYKPRLSDGQEFAVRFVNTDSDQNVSFDYALDGNQWFIGTSKNTMYAILDMHVKP